MSQSLWGLALTTLLATTVEMVEALTVVLAMGITRGWRSALWGVGAAVAVLAVFTVTAGYSLAALVPRSALLLGLGGLTLVFGLHWLRKAVLRAAGRKALSNETTRFDKNTSAARTAGQERRWGLDWFGFVVSFKAVLLEGVEVVFIVLTFGLNAGNVAVASAAAAVASILVVTAGVLVHGPLTKVPENTFKFVVGLLLCTFGTFWTLEGVELSTGSDGALPWWAGDGSLIVVLVLWLAMSWAAVAVLRTQPGDPAAGSPAP